jgi:hypothetical protein
MKKNERTEYNKNLAYLTFDTNKGALSRKSVHQILGRLRGLSLPAIQATPDVGFLFRGRAKLSQILTTDRTPGTVM